jgi:predicted GIY-YIG superfamily endonuclease/uncharacterized protein YegL
MTNNLSRRIAHHNRGFGAKYTRGRGPVTLLKFFPCASKSEALKLEARIKKLSRHQKLAFQLDISQPTPSKKDLTMKNDFTAIAVVLDASGSMSGITDDTIGSFNQFLAEQKALPGEAAFTLCVFNTDYRLVHDFQPLASVANLTNKTYRPMGGTALLDAMGTTIDSLGARLAAMPEDQRPSKVIVVVQTDGEENSSHRYSLAEIRSKIVHQQEVYSWEFIFLGANIDAVTTGTSMGFTAGASVQYNSTGVGTQSALRAVSASVTSYRSSGVLDTSGLSSLTTDPNAVSNPPAVAPVTPAVAPVTPAKSVFDPGSFITKK